jgi:hypothetical protein
MSGSVLHKIRPCIKRVEFREKSTTRGTRFKQSPVKAKPSPSRAPPKRSNPVEVEESGNWQDEPLLQYKGKVSSIAEYDEKWQLIWCWERSRKMTTLESFLPLPTIFWA